MANKLLLAALVAAAAVLGCVAIGTFLRPCPCDDGDCSASPSLVPGTDPGFNKVDFLIGALMGLATGIIFFILFADHIMKAAAGYFTIRGDPKAGGKIQ